MGDAEYVRPEATRRGSGAGGRRRRPGHMLVEVRADAEGPSSGLAVRRPRKPGAGQEADGPGGSRRSRPRGHAQAEDLGRGPTLVLVRSRRRPGLPTGAKRGNVWLVYRIWYE